MNRPEQADPRAEARTAWTRAVLRDDTAEPIRASMDAGFRSYWRAQAKDASGLRDSVIVMDSPPDKEDVRPWLQVRGLLQAGGVRVPQVLAEDVEAGFLLLEDLGTDTYLHVIDAGNALGGIDILVSNASALGIGNTEAAWQSGMKIDILGAVNAFEAAQPFLEKAAAGHDPGPDACVANLAPRRGSLPT